MESRRLQLLPLLDIGLEYPADIPDDVLSAAEMVLNLLAPAFAQLNVKIGRALFEVNNTEVKIMLYRLDETLVTAYSLPIDALLDAVNHAYQWGIDIEMNA